MSNPSPEERSEMLNALISHSLDFIERAISEFEDHPLFAVTDFAIGVELALKARLFAEHWVLVLENPQSDDWQTLRSGQAKTVVASDLWALVSNATGLSKPGAKKPNKTQVGLAFKKIFEHRNSVVHFVPKGDDDATATRALEVMHAWEFLHGFMLQQWKEAFKGAATRIAVLHDRVLNLDAYLEARLVAIEPELTGLRHVGLLAVCAWCEKNAAVVTLSHESSIASVTCKICLYGGVAAKLECDQWVSLGRPPPVSCACGQQHDEEALSEAFGDAEELMEIVDPTIAIQTKHDFGLEQERAFCEFCESETVVPAGKGYSCTVCFEHYISSAVAVCEWCSTRWVGPDLDDSASVGCPECGGLIGHQVDKGD